MRRKGHNTTMLLKSEDIAAVHAGGVDAVSGVIEHLQALSVAQQEQTAALSARVKGVEDQAKTTSRPSSQPPSSDGYRRPPRSLRQHSGKAIGGQPWYAGSALSLVDAPDRVLVHRLATCAMCHAALDGVAATGYKWRGVVDLPPLRLEVSEHRAEKKTCPHCRQTTRGTFPADVTAGVQYREWLTALAVYLLTYHLLLYERMSALLGDLFGQAAAKGTLQTALETCAEGLAGIEERIKDALREADVLHNDGTGARVQGALQWVHVMGMPRLTHYIAHPKRGRDTMTDIGILPAFHGISAHDGLTAYRQYDCAHALCNAHHPRELTAIEEHDQQPWATRMKDLLMENKARVATARAPGGIHVDAAVCDAFVARFQAIVAKGYAANPPPEQTLGRRNADDPSRATPAPCSIGAAATSRRCSPS